MKAQCMVCGHIYYLAPGWTLKQVPCPKCGCPSRRYVGRHDSMGNPLPDLEKVRKVTTTRHNEYYLEPCPITGKPIPPDTIYTDHNRIDPEECRVVFFNACGACGENKTPAQRLHELNEERKKKGRK